MLPRSLAIAAALAIAACSREPAPAKSKPLPRIEAPRAGAGPEVPAKEGDIDALKERLARQEAAARMFERQVLEPPPPSRLPIPAPLPREREPAPPNAAAEPENRPPVAPAARAKAVTASPGPDIAASAPPTASTVPAAPSPAPPASPAARADAAADWKLIRRVEPEFPREALQARVDRGTVRARVTIDAAGSVTRVEVLDSRPRRVFDRAVVRALSQWKFSGGSDGRTMETEVYFHR